MRNNIKIKTQLHVLKDRGQSSLNNILLYIFLMLSQTLEPNTGLGFIGCLYKQDWSGVDFYYQRIVFTHHYINPL